MIPNRLIFIWLGKTLPWSAGVAIRSANSVQNPSEILLYHEGLEQSGAGWDLIKEIPTLQVTSIDDSIFANLPDDGNCVQLYRELKSPATRANLVRLAVLYHHGGVYLDTDIIAISPWNDLLSQPGFCGLEPVALPAHLFGSLNPINWIICGLRFAWRDLCTRLPKGEQWFRIFEGNFAMVANNAVIGSQAHNPILEQAFVAIAKMNPLLQRKRFRLGTHLLQNITQNRSSQNMTTYPANYFFPVGPEVSCHWFRDGSAQRLANMLYPETKVVHWYNSVEARFLQEPLNQQWLIKHPNTAFSELIRRYANLPA